MQEAKNHHPATDLPSQLADRIIAADAILLIRITDEGAIETTGINKNQPFVPHLDASHAYLQAVRDAHPDLLKKVLGEITDADRYRALRAFSTLVQTNKEQFERVNEMVFEFEKTLPPEGERSGADMDSMADFLVHALIETTPVFAAPTAQPEASNG